MATSEDINLAIDMGATGVCWDNSVAESWFGTMKRELAHRRRWATRADARRDLIRWSEGWFNPSRLHSSNNYRSPLDWEKLHYRRRDGVAASPPVRQTGRTSVSRYGVAGLMSPGRSSNGSRSTHRPGVQMTRTSSMEIDRMRVAYASPAGARAIVPMPVIWMVRPLR